MGKNKKKNKNHFTDEDNEIIENQQEQSDFLHSQESSNPTPTQPAEDSAATPQTEQSDPELTIKSLQEEIADLKDKNLRMMAEFDNFRRRTNKEKLDLIASAGETIFKEMLPLIDDFERAIAASRNTTNDGIQQLQNGIELIYTKFLHFLTAHNISEIPTQNTEFSTDIHEALTTVEAGKEQAGKIIECTRKGYKLGDKVIRYAQVVVGK